MTTATDLVHTGEATRWGGWEWRKPRRGEFFRTCSYCGSIHPEDLAPRLVAQLECAVCGQTGWEAHFRAQQPSWYPGLKADGKLADTDLTEEDLARLDAAPPEHPYDPGGAYASWADQKYGWPHKFYVEGLRPQNPEMLHCTGHATGPRSDPPDWGRNWVAASDLTRGQKRIITTGGMRVRGEKFTGWYLFQPRATLFAKFYTKHLADPAIPDEAKEKIYAACGLRFHFTDDGRVSWHGASYSCEEVHPTA